MTAQHEAIIREIYKAVERLGGSRELLGVIGSWGNTLTDEEVLEALQQINAGRRLFDEVFASTGGPALDVDPSPRRSPKAAASMSSPVDLTDEQRQALIGLLTTEIEASRYPLSPRITMLKEIREKLRAPP